MAGHSHSSNVKHRKNAVDAKKARLFTKICKDIQICVRTSGLDNARLKTLLEQARKMNVPKTNIDKALQSGNQTNGEIMIYQGFALGIAFIIKTYTSNKNKSAAEIRAVLRKFDGDLSTCDYLFDENYKAYTYMSKPDNFEQLYELIEEIDEVEEIFCNVEHIQHDE